MVLTVDSHRLGWGLTHHTAADVRADLFLGEWHHRKRSCTGQPVGLVISLGVVAHLVDVAVRKGQSAKHRQTRSCQTKILIVRLLLSFHV